jgi:murein DD-endopeptidase MepM/ murein hydrolase activator NlpD
MTHEMTHDTLRRDDREAAGVKAHLPSDRKITGHCPAINRPAKSCSFASITGLDGSPPLRHFATVVLRTTLALVCLLLVAADWPKWKVRRREGDVPNRFAAALLDPTSWTPEPPSPKRVDIARLARSLRAVCDGLSPAQAEQYAHFIHESASVHEEDPFLIATLMVHASRCRGDAKELRGIGLTGIQPEMYRGNVSVDMLQYEVREGHRWAVRAKMIARPLTAKTLKDPQQNIEWAAALLAMWREQHDAIDAQFEQAPHRHYVSHFLWGDRVQSARAEDMILTARRRLLENYNGVTRSGPSREFRAITFGCPLEGSPRIVSSKPGADRDHGLRMHRGVDVDADIGEPVLAMADGLVTFAGVDFPGRGTAVDLPPDQIHRVPLHEMGAGGRYVCITHLPDPDRRDNPAAMLFDRAVMSVPRAPEDNDAPDNVANIVKFTELNVEAPKCARIELEAIEITARDPSRALVSCYMHLDTTRVRSGQDVKRGEVIGTVGRTGVKESATHLHLELKSERELFDARDVLSGILIGDPAWHSTDEERRARRRARAEGLTSRAMASEAVAY